MWTSQKQRRDYFITEELWDKISFEESAVPVPESHMRELDRRLARHKSSPGELLSLDELRKRLESRSKRRKHVLQNPIQ
jgi:putative addiction module component (TIGR02574 family)